MCPDPRSQINRKAAALMRSTNGCAIMIPFSPLGVTLTFRAVYAVPHLSPEDEFLVVIGTKVLKAFLIIINNLFSIKMIIYNFT
jgi:hypothetical protein